MNISTPENKRVHFHHWLTYCCAIILTERSPPSALCVYEFAYTCSVTTVLVFPFSRSLQSVALFMYNLSNHVHTTRYTTSASSPRQLSRRSAVSGAWKLAASGEGDDASAFEKRDFFKQQRMAKQSVGGLGLNIYIYIIYKATTATLKEGDTGIPSFIRIRREKMKQTGRLMY